ncbi:unnamed protein product, partial [marine sediment metagenome]
KQTAEKIITALTNRSGFNDLWYNLDEDIQTEITDEIVNILPIHDVSQRTYFFDCWKMNGVMDCKEIVATCEEHAILKFEKEFDDYGYDPPYVG